MHLIDKELGKRESILILKSLIYDLIFNDFNDYLSQEYGAMLIN